MPNLGVPQDANLLECGGLGLRETSPPSLRAHMVYQRIGKRLFDLVLVILSAPFWLPAMGLVAILVRIGLGSPVIFRQSRPGLSAQPFVLLKFRTMTFDRDDDGRLLPDAERLTAIGRLLRSSSLDELPELLNVLKGEMSLVGPRPILARDLERCSLEHAQRYELRSGMSGWAQVNGRNALSWQQKFDMDLWYLENLSLWTDLKIVVMTVGRVLAADNVFAADQRTAPEFQGFADEKWVVDHDDRPSRIDRS